MSPPQTKVSVFLRDTLLHEQVLPAGRYILGQGKDADIRFSAEGVADLHARLILRGGQWLLENLDGGRTFVDGRAVEKLTVIVPHQEVRLGAARLVLDSTPGSPLDSAALRVRHTSTEEMRRGKNYTIGEAVGHGGMGVIHSAEEEPLQRKVAMKVMHDASKPGAMERFQLEAQVTAQLEHPNIVPVHDLGVDSASKPYYTMKLVRGHSLREVLDALEANDAEAVRQWPLSVLLTVFQKVCDALAFAHSKGVIHRDLKPANIMVGEYGEALVMDWGLAKILGRNLPTTASPVHPHTSTEVEAIHDADATTIGPTTYGTVMGTAQYMPPEQANGELELLDERSDIYSLGAILYHLIALRPPFHGHNSAEVILNVRAGRIVPFAEACAGKRRPHWSYGRFPKSLAAVALKAMSPQKEGRYFAVKQLQVEIEAWQSGFATVAEDAGMWTLLSLFLRRHRTVSLAAALLLVSGIVFSINLLRERNRAERASDEAHRATLQAAEQRDAAENDLYRSDMLQAGRHLADGRPEAARQLLQFHRRKTSRGDLRDWEWYYLMGEANQDRLHINAHRRGVLALAASADGARLATGGGDGEIALWQSRGLVPQWRKEAHAGGVLAVSWHRTGKWLATGGADGFVRIWDVEAQKAIAQLRVGTGKPVRAVAWQPNDGGLATVAIGGLEREIVLWHPLAGGDPGSPEVLATTSPRVAALHWSADGARLAAGEINSANTLEVFDYASREKILSTGALGGNDVFAAALDPAGRYVAAGSKHLTVGVFDIQGKKIVYSETFHHGFVSALAWSPDGQQLASASHDGTIRVCAPTSDSPISKVLNGHVGEVNTLAWVKLPPQEGGIASTALYSGGSDGTLRAWLPASVEDIEFTAPNWIAAAQWDATGAQIVTAWFREQIQLVDPVTGLGIAMSSFNRRSIFDAAWSPDGTRVATASRGSGRVEILEAGTGRSLGVHPLPNAGRVAWSPSGRYLAGGGRQETRIWDTTEGTLVSTIARPTGSLAWHPDERRLALGSEDGAIELWDAFTGKIVATWKSAPPPTVGAITSEFEPPHMVFDVRWSPDARFLAFGTQDNIAGLLDASDGHPVRQFSGHSSGVWRVAWSPSGRRLATAGQDGVVRIFATDTGGQVAQITHGTGNHELHALDWSSDGHRVLSGGYDHNLRIRDEQRGRWIEDIDRRTNEGRDVPQGADTLGKLAHTYAQLGWVDKARLTFGLAQSAAPTDPALRSTIADCEAAFARALDIPSPEWMTAPALIAAKRHSLELLAAVRDNWEIGKADAAIRAYRELAKLPNTAPLLPIAHTHLSNAHWTATWFSAKTDPLKDLAGWRALAQESGAFRGEVRALIFPYQKGGPNALLLDSSPSPHPFGAGNFGMIAHSRINFPAGKWHLHASGDGGVRVLAGEKVILENWTAGAPREKFANFETTAAGDVEITVEHFVVEPTAGFQFLIEPVTP